MLRLTVVCLAIGAAANAAYQSTLAPDATGWSTLAIGIALVSQRRLFRR